MDTQYYLEGTVRIPEKKRAELNENILKLLWQCGMRKLQKMQLAGKTVTVVQKPMPDEKGMVHFDYSIFEQTKREGFYYDTNTCRLHTSDCGYREFHLIVAIIMTMLESYSAEHCYLMRENQLCGVEGYATMVEQLIGLKLSFPKREKMWDMFAFFKSNEKYAAMTYEIIWDKFPYDYAEIDLEQLILCRLCSEKSAEMPKDYVSPQKSEIGQTRFSTRVYYTYELLRNLIQQNGKEKVRTFLKNLLEMDCLAREELAQAEDEFGKLAGISLYEPPAGLVTAYSWAVQEDFWELWFSLETTGYQDVYKEDHEEMEQEETEAEPLQHFFYKILEQDYEDEFLEFWDNQELVLSAGLRRNMTEWKRMYETVEAPEMADFSMEEVLADILVELQETWNCRYVDEALARDFLEHKDMTEYQKALLVFRKLQDKLLYYFPELTAGQIKEWVIKRFCGSKEKRSLSAYASLLTNKMRRADLLGF